MAENIENETSFSKGEKFEKLFAEFMKSNLGWDGYVIRSQQKGKRNSKGAQVDIIAKRNDERGRRIYKAGIIYGFFFLLISVVGIALVLTETITTNEFLWICLFAIAFAILSLYTLIISTSFHKENAWVECKNLKGKATYEQVQKCLQEFNDYKLSGDKEYKYVVLYFVSASGFVENALKLAMDNDIICYELKNENFEKVTYWK